MAEVVDLRRIATSTELKRNFEMFLKEAPYLAGEFLR